VVIPIRFGGYQPARSVHSRAARRFGDALKRRLGDGVEGHAKTGRRRP